MRAVAISLLLLGAFAPTHAQLHVTRPKATPRVQVPARARTLPPLDCKAMAAQWREPWMRDVCEKSNYDFGTHYARVYGMPRPSRDVVSLPAHGSPQAKAYGVACIGQLAMRRLPNGWEQLRDREGNYLRCREL
jgi:hypothetical protein